MTQISGAAAQAELILLLACARTRHGEAEAREIRSMLEGTVDWAVFARKAITHGVASLVGQTLARTVPDMVPDDVLEALRMNQEYVRARNAALSGELARTIAGLANHGVEAIGFKGPVLGTRAYGDPAPRMFGDPAMLLHERELRAAVNALRELGYERKAQLSEAQLDLIHHLQGRERMNNRSLRMAIEVHTRVMPASVALDIDHAGLWQRARPISIGGTTMLALAPEDELLALALRDAGDDAWRLDQVCDFAALVASHPDLDWHAIAARARAQGSMLMLLVAATLARECFHADMTDEIRAAAADDPEVAALVRRTIGQWQSDEPAGPPGEHSFSLERLRLHDGAMRRARYVARSMFLPAPPHVSRIRLPRSLTRLPAYMLLKLAQDVAMLPLLRAYRGVRAQAGRVRDLLASHELGLAIIPIAAEQRSELRRFNAARAAADRVLANDPNNLAAWQNRGDALFRLKRYKAAVASYDKALAIAPENSILWRKRAAAVRIGSGQPASVATDDTAAFDPGDADAWARHAASLAASQRFAEAVAAADRALAISPRHLIAMRVGIRSRIVACDWRRRDEDERWVAESFSAGLDILTPAGNRAISDSEAQNLIAAKLWVRPFVLPAASPWRDTRYRHDRIRLGYLCSEFHDHPAGRQIVGVLEHHDRTRFETIAVSLGGPNPSAIRRRIEDACDRFVSVYDMPDEQIAATVRDMEIDIAIDLDRLAARARPGVLARRPAPLQVSYFGNAGTTGAPFFDYIIADRSLIPREHFKYYSEQVIYLPNSYQCNDDKRPVAEVTLSRAEAGLPETGFVFCCFNQNYKISPPVFDIWMRLLHACPGSVLWLLAGEPYAIHNLRREAAARGIASERIVLAPFVANDMHIARHRLADLFLDTVPCNAHATASDALWAGLPILTCLGNTFAGRVGASLLRAVGLPEMVTSSLTQYEELALALARDPPRLAAITAKLAGNRATDPLFDTAGFTRDLEAAFTAIWSRQQAGLAPEALAP